MKLELRVLCIEISLTLFLFRFTITTPQPPPMGLFLYIFVAFSFASSSSSSSSSPFFSFRYPYILHSQLLLSPFLSPPPLIPLSAFSILEGTRLSFENNIRPPGLTQFEIKWMKLRPKGFVSRSCPEVLCFPSFMWVHQILSKNNFIYTSIKQRSGLFVQQ